MDAEEVEEVSAQAQSTYTEERNRTKAGFSSCPDPARSHEAASTSDLARLKKQFPFLLEYTDSFIKATGIEALVKMETASKKLQKLDEGKRAEDRLYNNREALASATQVVEGGLDNRVDILHPARVLPGATCTAAKMWLHARSILGSSGHVPVSTYDMASIGMGGCVTPRGWIEIHNPASPHLSVKMFSMSSCINSNKNSSDLEYPEMEDIFELKGAIRVMRGALAFAHPWNRSVDALESFLYQNNYCSKDLAGADKQAQILCQFVDYVLGENASRWRGMEPFLSTRDLRATWADYLNQKGNSLGSKQKQMEGGGSRQYKQQSSRVLPSARYSVPPHLFLTDICVMWNLGKCIKPPGACINKRGKVLRHVCNFTPDLSKPALMCEKNHMCSLFHR